MSRQEVRPRGLEGCCFGGVRAALLASDQRLGRRDAVLLLGYLAIPTRLGRCRRWNNNNRAATYNIVPVPCLSRIPKALALTQMVESHSHFSLLAHSPHRTVRANQGHLRGADELWIFLQVWRLESDNTALEAQRGQGQKGGAFVRRREGHPQVLGRASPPEAARRVLQVRFSNV